MSKAFIIVFFSFQILLSACSTTLTLTRSASEPPGTISAGPILTDEPPAQNCTADFPPDIRFGFRRWPNTDFCQHSIPYEEIMGILGRDRIPALDDPGFESIAEADLWLTDLEPVQVLKIGGDVRAYPLPILIWHEIVNDVVGGQPVVITYCPLCNSALVFERSVGDRLLDFGTTGNIRMADLIMYDRQTESWWQQFEGKAVVGELTGTKLSHLPSSIVSYADFKAQHPDGLVLSIYTGYDRQYGETPYVNYDSLANFGTRFFDGETDDRLPPKMRVLALRRGEATIAYPYNILEEKKIINDWLEGEPIAVFWKPGTLSPVFAPLIFESKDIGSAAAFSRELNGQTLTFKAGADSIFLDEETGSAWNIFGTAVSGPLDGQQLTAQTAHEFFWFAWAAFQPETILYEW